MRQLHTDNSQLQFWFWYRYTGRKCRNFRPVKFSLFFQKVKFNWKDAFSSFFYMTKKTKIYTGQNFYAYDTVLFRIYLVTTGLVNCCRHMKQAKGRSSPPSSLISNSHISEKRITTIIQWYYNIYVHSL